MILHTQRLLLRELRSADLASVHHLHSLPETDRYNTLGIPASMEDTEELLKKWLQFQEVSPRSSYIFYLQEKSSGNFTGLIALNLGKPGFRIAEVWYKLHPRLWGRGYATEALNALLHFGFSSLKLHRIEAGCATENKASIRVLEKVGMLREGSKRKVLPIRGQWVDNYEYALLEEDYLQQGSTSPGL